MPFIETPYWCLQKNGEHPIQKTLIYDCHVDMADYEVRYSSFANLNPILTYSLDICCVVFLVYFRWFKSLWSVQTSQDKLRNYLFNALAIVSILIFAVTMWLRETAFVADLLRPFIVVNFLSTQRQNLDDFFRDIWSSATVLITIFAWIFLLSLVGFFLFRYSFEGVAFFGSIKVSYSSMLTLLTTANFPDVMLPVYYTNYFSILFFFLYLMVGLYFLMNLLLASVFSKFKDRYQERITANQETRRKRVEQLYQMFDKRGRDYLNPEEFKQLLAFVFDIRMRSRVGREYYKRILAKLGLSDRENIPRELLVEYLVERGAMEKKRVVEA